MVQSLGKLFLLLCGLARASAVLAAEMQYPLGIAATDNGPIYVADRNHACNQYLAPQSFRSSIAHPTIVSSSQPGGMTAFNPAHEGCGSGFLFCQATWAFQ